MSKIQRSKQKKRAKEGTLCARAGERQLAQIAGVLWQVGADGGMEGVGRGAAGKLAKPRLVTDVDANCGFLITPSSPTIFSIFHFVKLEDPLVYS